MVEKREDIEALIAMYLRGEATPEQAMELDAWRNESPDHQALYEMLEALYTTTTGKARYTAVDVEKGWNKVKPLLTEQPTIVPLWKNKQLYLGAAAIAVIAFLIGSFWQSAFNSGTVIGENPVIDTVNVQPTILVANNTIESFELVDRSKIKLQPGSSVELASDYNKTERALTLKGSGTFDVVHNDNIPFIIDVEGLKVKDVGTVFDVLTIGDTVKVVVAEGEVQLQLNGELINVVAGDSAFYVISQQLIERYKEPEARQDKIFEFNGTSLKEVVGILGQFFNKKIVIMDKEIENCPVSVTFKNESLATILDIISELLDIKVIRNNEIIGIYGSSCV